MTFKAKVIENDQYYRLKRNIGIITLLLIPLYSVLPNAALPSNMWLFLIGMMGLAFLMYYQFVWQKNMLGLVNQRKIEITPDDISIIDKKGNKQVYSVKNADSIIVKESFKMPDENFKDIYKDLNGQPIKNYIVYKDGNGDQRFEFTIDSYYMIEQMKKLIQGWQLNGINVKTTSQTN